MLLHAKRGRQVDSNFQLSIVIVSPTASQVALSLFLKKRHQLAQLRPNLLQSRLLNQVASLRDDAARALTIAQAGTRVFVMDLIIRLTRLQQAALLTTPA